MFDNLVEKFAEKRTTVLQTQRTQAQAMDQLDQLNHDFYYLYDAWNELQPGVQQAAMKKYVRAQRDFHFIADLLLVDVHNPQLADSNDTSAVRMNTDETNHDVSQLQFGDFPNEGSSTESMIRINDTHTQLAPDSHATNVHTSPEASGMLPATAANLGSLSAGEPNMNQHSDSTGEMQTEYDSTKLQAAASVKTNNVQCDQQQQPMDCDPMNQIGQPLRTLVMVAYSEQAIIFAPVLGSTPIVNVTEPILNVYLDAISRVTHNLKRENILIDRTAERLIILQIISSLDKVSKQCWGFVLQANNEPTLQILATFLLNRVENVKEDGITDINPTSRQASAWGEFVIPKLTPKKTKPIARNDRSRSPVNQAGPSGQRRASASGGAVPKLKCAFCNGPHDIIKCDEYRKLSCQDREVEAVRRHLCINCLKPGHQAKMCKQGCCKSCNGKHNSLLHHRGA